MITNKKKRIDSFIKDINSKPPSNIVTGIYNYQNQHSRWLTQTYWGFTKYYEESFDFYVNLVSSVNYVKKDNWGWNKKLPFIYLGNSTYPLFKSYTLLTEGFYDESLSVSRNAYELLIKSLFCLLHPDDAFATYEQPKAGKLKYNLSNFLEHDLKVNWSFLYRLSSSSSHGKLYLTRILSDLKERGKHENIGLRLKVDEKTAQVNINYLTFLIWAHIYLFSTIFTEIVPTKSINKHVKKETKEYIYSLGNIIKELPYPNSFPQVVRDFEKTMKRIKISNNHAEF